MSATEQGMTFCAGEGGLSPSTLARLERIRQLSRQNRRQYAIAKRGVRSAECGIKTNPKTSKARKDKKPYFYNPAQRD